MKQKKLLAVCISVAGLTCAETSFSDVIADAFKQGAVSTNFRLRYEEVEQDGLTNDKEDALTLRSRITYTTAPIKGLSGTVEIDDITALMDIDYRTAPNDPNNAGAPVIADPEGTEVNQVYLDYIPLADHAVRWGRQRVVLDNERFIGPVGFRLNEQTFDGLVYTNKSLPKTILTLGYLGNVNRIFGEDNAVGDVEMETKIFNANYAGLPFGAISAYAYQLENDDSNTAFDLWSTNTYGVRFVGGIGAASKLTYTAEFAKQSDAADNTRTYDADYNLLEAGFSHGIFSAGLGYEKLGADGSDGFFITPLATLHKFQGWADKFLGSGGIGNISTGIIDEYATAAVLVQGVKIGANYHQYKPDEETAAIEDLGDEVGLFVSQEAIMGAYMWELKYADYSAGDTSTTGDTVFSDTKKIWLALGAKF